MSKLTVVALSDTHTLHRQVVVPDGDVLVFAGDLMGSGYNMKEVRDFSNWFSLLPHRYKILVAGNHDRSFENRLEECLEWFPHTVTYLEDSSTTIEGFRFWGSPYQPAFCNWAFNVPRDLLYRHWVEIPSDTDILVTHGPPYGKLDQSNAFWVDGWHLGDVSLKNRVEQVSPSHHIFGHIHGGYGETKDIATVYHNVSICNEMYEAVNKPQVFEIVN